MTSGLVVVDKPAGVTSHDVVARVRRLAGTRKVGHAGTLDPMATGVLAVGINRATRLLGHQMVTEKGYDLNYTWGMNSHGQKFGGAVFPDMMRWLWRDGPVSADPKDMVERDFRQPVQR